MGGEGDHNNNIMPTSSSSSSSSSEHNSALHKDFPQPSSSFLGNDDDDGLSMNSETFGNCVETLDLDLETKSRIRDKNLREILRSYEELRTRGKGLEEAKSKILSYKPGGWMDMLSDAKSSCYDVPTTTSLLLVGPRGAGKSSLVNRISKVFEGDEFVSQRAQETYSLAVGEGTVFLQEYMIPRWSTSFCLYDTRSLSDDSSENMEILKRWMTRGVCNGKLVSRGSDTPSMRRRMERKAQNNGDTSDDIKNVNFVIFVVDGLSVLKSLKNDNEADRSYTDVIVSAFNSPYVSFQDDKPLVVVTHGDLISHFDRARIRVHLGELLGIPPTKQIFDIPDKLDLETELTIIDMLRYSLEHADKNLPPKRSFINRRIKVITPYLPLILLLVLMVGVAIIVAYILSCPSPQAKFSKHQTNYDTQGGKAKCSETRTNYRKQVEENFPKAQAKGDIEGLIKFPESHAKDEESEVQTKYPEPQAKNSLQDQAKSEEPQPKDGVERQEIFSEAREKYDVQGQSEFPKPREKYDTRRQVKFQKAQVKEDKHRQAKFTKARGKDGKGNFHHGCIPRATKPQANDDIHWHEIRHLWLGEDV